MVGSVVESGREPSWTIFEKKLRTIGKDLSRGNVETLQVNLGKLCNQACLHCHVEAGPNKTKENMTKETIERILFLLDQSLFVKTVDLTGGAPEMNVHFQWFVKELRKRHIDVIDRCNLTVLLLPQYELMAQFLAENKVRIVASLPCYRSRNVEKQRGTGVFDESIGALQRLNQLGYGKEGSELGLDLVYNPVGASLPPSQKSLEVTYKKNLFDDFGIVFNRLLTITNMPIKRFLYQLKRRGNYQEYMQLLFDHFNIAAIDSVMCRNTLSISWDGKIFDCDFNQMLGLRVDRQFSHSIWDLDNFAEFQNGRITLGDHCYGCTAGAGSSCGGALTDN